MSKDKTAPTVCVSVQALYDAVTKPRFCTIEIESDDSGKVVNYLDLYNDQGDLACMDGEECTVFSVEDDLVTFGNDCGEGTVFFVLTKEEADIASFGWMDSLTDIL